MKIDIVGEDQVTQTIIERLINDYRTDLSINNRLPVRGGQIQTLAPKLNLLDSRIFLLTDLDNYDCPPSLVTDWLGGQPVNPQLLFRVAKDEAESWLMSDREGFSKWLQIDIDLIPTPSIIDNKTGAIELVFPYKPSLYMMLTMASKSSNKELKEYLTPVKGAKKGPGYNSAILPYIKDKWDIENAAKNSESLARTIQRLQAY